MRAYLGIGLALAATVALSLTHHSAYLAGAASERQAILTRSVEILRERNATDETIRDLSARDLCLKLGGLQDECAGL